MASLTLDASGESIDPDVSRVVCRLAAGELVTYLPKINDGRSGDSVAVGTEISVETHKCRVIVCTNLGRRVSIVQPHHSATFIARSGTQEGGPDVWQVVVV